MSEPVQLNLTWGMRTVSLTMVPVSSNGICERGTVGPVTLLRLHRARGEPKEYFLAEVTLPAELVDLGGVHCDCDRVRNAYRAGGAGRAVRHAHGATSVDRAHAGLERGLVHRHARRLSPES